MRSLIELRRKRNGIEVKGVEDKADTMPIPLLLLLDHSALEFVDLTGLDVSIRMRIQLILDVGSQLAHKEEDFSFISSGKSLIKTWLNRFS